MKQLILLAILATATAQAQFSWSGSFTPPSQPASVPAPPRRTMLGNILRWKSGMINDTANNFDTLFSKISFIGGGKFSFGGAAQTAQQAPQTPSPPAFIFIPVLPSVFGANGSISIGTVPPSMLDSHVTATTAKSAETTVSHTHVEASVTEGAEETVAHVEDSVTEGAEETVAHVEASVTEGAEETVAHVEASVTEGAEETETVAPPVVPATGPTATVSDATSSNSTAPAAVILVATTPSPLIDEYLELADKFPLKSESDIDKLEALLADPTIKKIFESFLRAQTGPDEFATIKFMVKSIIAATSIEKPITWSSEDGSAIDPKDAIDLSTTEIGSSLIKALKKIYTDIPDVIKESTRERLEDCLYKDEAYCKD